jgi:cysteine desulfurase/selenocysteine lyase
VGLAAALDFIKSIGFDQLWKHEQQLTAHLHEVLSTQKGVHLLGRGEIEERISLFCFKVDSVEAEDLARRLDQYGIAIRAGDIASLPLLERFGVKRAARASLYLYNTTAEIDSFADKLAMIAGRV